jgi:TetR/AcrR family transcriptional regulator, lmrAB and yxaGH operons repressor
MAETRSYGGKRASSDRAERESSDRGKRGSSREAFLRATAELLQRQGYTATPVNEIVARSGAPKGSLYYLFPGGKEELAVAAMAHSGERLRRAIVAILDSSETLGESLGRLVDAMAAGLEGSSFRDGCPIATVTLEAASGSDAVRAAAELVFAGWLQALQARLRVAGLTAEAAERRALLVLAAIEGALILARARRDTGPLRAVRYELIALCD